MAGMNCRRTDTAAVVVLWRMDGIGVIYIAFNGRRWCCDERVNMPALANMILSIMRCLGRHHGGNVVG